jgi:GxxExxY protein
MGEPLLHESLTKSIIGAFFEVYNELDFGFLEHMCVSALEIELAKRGHSVAREVGIRVWYKGQDIGAQRLDMIVDDAVVVEVKSTLVLHPSAMRQLTSYLRATNIEVGLLLHFGEKASFYRRVLSNKNKKNIRPLSAIDPPQSALGKHMP